jgi:hypothetical protein
MQISDSHARRASGVAASIVFVAVLWLLRADLKGVAAVLWPLVVACAVYMFRSSIGELLRRLKRVDTSGAEFEARSIVAQSAATPVDQILRDVAPGETQHSYIRARLETLRAELNARQPDDLARREFLLLLRLAEAQQVRDWSFVWMQIFASQLEALAAMAAYKNR